jgi:hypothetical protein
VVIPNGPADRERHKTVQRSGAVAVRSRPVSLNHTRMRPTDFLIALALTSATAGTAAAQTSSTPIAGVAPRSGWVVSGFAGANFDTTIDNAADVNVADIDSNASLSFGGQLAYLWRDAIGWEALVDFAPAMGVAGTVFADKPNVYSYMANVIAAVPVGHDAKYPLYISGGFGAIHLLADVFNTFGNPRDGATSSNDIRFGANVGGGLMAFTGRIGLRADVRFYKATADDGPLQPTTADTVVQAALSDLGFWRGNIGMAIRW